MSELGDRLDEFNDKLGHEKRMIEVNLLRIEFGRKRKRLRAALRVLVPNATDQVLDDVVFAVFPEWSGE